MIMIMQLLEIKNLNNLFHLKNKLPNFIIKFIKIMVYKDK